METQDFNPEDRRRELEQKLAEHFDLLNQNIGVEIPKQWRMFGEGSITILDVARYFGALQTVLIECAQMEREVLILRGGVK